MKIVLMISISPLYILIGHIFYIEILLKCDEQDQNIKIAMKNSLLHPF